MTAIDDIKARVDRVNRERDQEHDRHTWTAKPLPIIPPEDEVVTLLHEISRLELELVRKDYIIGRLVRLLEEIYKGCGWFTERGIKNTVHALGITFPNVEENRDRDND